MGKKANEKRKALFAQLEKPTKKRTAMKAWNSHEPLVVRVQELQAILRPIIEEIDAYRNENVTDTIGGITYIAGEVGIESVRVRKFMGRTDGYVGLAMVDRWLTALGLVHEVQNLQFVPNPKWTQERWQRWAEKNGHC
jgi:hypothetical protein